MTVPLKLRFTYLESNDALRSHYVKVTDMEGRELQSIVEIKFHMVAGGVPLLQITLVPDEIELEGEAQFQDLMAIPSDIPVPVDPYELRKAEFYAGLGIPKSVMESSEARFSSPHAAEDQFRAITHLPKRKPFFPNGEPL